LFSPYYSEILAEQQTTASTANWEPLPIETHSDTCFICQRYKDFLQKKQDEIDSKNDDVLLENEELGEHTALTDKSTTAASSEHDDTNDEDEHFDSEELDALTSTGVSEDI